MTIKLSTDQDFRRMADIVLAASKGDHTFLRLTDSLATTLRFANNQAVQHISERSPGLTVTVAFGKKAGSASTGKLDEASLREAVARAEAIARVTPEDPEYLPPLGPQTYLSVPSFQAPTAAATPMDFARKTKPVIDRCIEKGLTAAGITTSTVSARGVAASTGLFAFEPATEAEFSLTATAEDSSGWTFNSHRNADALDLGRQAGWAIDKAILSKKPRELPAGKYPVILEPAAVAGLVGPIFFSARAKNYYKGNSPFVGKLGSAILDKRLTLRSDPAHPQLLGSRFNGDGLPARPVTWIDRGVLKQLNYERFTAKEHQTEPTPSPDAPVLEFHGATAGSIEELIKSTKRAILVTNFWYIRYVNPVDLTITGMTRDGTFLIENGKITSGVKNFRFHESPLRCFASVEAATGPMDAATSERNKMLLPALRLPEFNFSSVTRF
jgi:predicted Zn-dependent protease